MPIQQSRLYPCLSLALVALLTLAGCSGEQQNAAAMPAPAVTVMTVQPESVPLVTELPGRTSPYLVAELRPQVTGIVKQRLFREGGEVKSGQVLYQIDPATYQAEHDSASASLARAEANLEVMRLKAERYTELMKTRAVSQQANDEAQAALKQAQADVAAAKAALGKARIDLDYTRVKSPISGRIGRSTVTPGALVTANQAEALATVQQLDPIYVDVTQSSTELLRLQRDLDSGKLKPAATSTLPVTLLLEDGSAYSGEGKLAFSEVTVDPGTGSVTLRAVFPNPRGELLPGMYVRARITQGVQDAAYLVPHAAVSRDPLGNAVVMVVGAEDKVEARIVRTTQSIGTNWVITDGLAPGERIITEGLQRVRPGAAVAPQEAGSAPAAPAAAAGG